MKTFCKKTILLILATLGLSTSACTTMKKVFAIDQEPNKLKPIENPFGDYYPDGEQQKQSMVFRTKKGDRSIEVELPNQGRDVTEVVVPVSPHFKDTERSPASYGTLGNAKASMADREITSRFPNNAVDGGESRNELEAQMGLVPSERDRPEPDTSYLNALDNIKQLYRVGRYEIAILENDRLLKEYPTDPKLHEMRGTLLDRMGQTDLAMKSWKQALKLSPGNRSLQKFIEKRETSKTRGLASP